MNLWLAVKMSRRPFRSGSATPMSNSRFVRKSAGGPASKRGFAAPAGAAASAAAASAAMQILNLHPTRRSVDRAFAEVPLQCRARVPDRRRLDRLRLRAHARSGSASGCSAAPPCHFALAASFFTDVRVVGPVGDDFGADEIGVLEARGYRHRRHRARRGRPDVLLARPLRPRHERRPHRRHPAQRLRRFRAEALARRSREAEMLFLGNIQPDLQREVRAQSSRRLRRARLDEPLDRDDADSLAARRSARSTACC